MSDNKLAATFHPSEAAGAPLGADQADWVIPDQCYARRSLYALGGEYSDPVILDCGRDDGHTGAHRDSIYELLWLSEADDADEVA